jgi:hypothetical protein
LCRFSFVPIPRPKVAGEKDIWQPGKGRNQREFWQRFALPKLPLISPLSLRERGWG